MAAGRRDPHARVVQQVLDLVDVRQGVESGDVPGHAQGGEQAEEGAGDVALDADMTLGLKGELHSFFIAPRMWSFRASQLMLDDLSMRSASTSAGHG